MTKSVPLSSLSGDKSVPLSSLTASSKSVPLSSLTGNKAKKSARSVPLSSINKDKNQGSWIGGAGEAAANFGSQMVSVPLSGLAGISDEAAKALGITKANPSEVVHKTQNELTYQPKTQKGKEVTHYINLPFELLTQGADAAGNYVYKKSGSPVAATAVKTAIEGAPALLGLKGIGRKTDHVTDHATAHPESYDATAPTIHVHGEKDAGNVTPETASAAPAEQSAQSVPLSSLEDHPAKAQTTPEETAQSVPLSTLEQSSEQSEATPTTVNAEPDFHAASLSKDHGPINIENIAPSDKFRHRFMNPHAGIEGALHDLGARRSIDEINGAQILDKARKEGITAKDQKAITDYIEQSHLPKDQQTFTLTPKQQHFHDTYYKPLREAIGASDGYLPREAQGKGGPVDWFKAGRKKRLGVGPLRKKVGSDNRRSYKTLTDEQGNRHLIHIEPAGRFKIKATEFKNGEAKPLGILHQKTEQKLFDEKAAPIDKKIKALQTERKHLKRNKGTEKAASRRINNIGTHIDLLNDEKDQLASEVQDSEQSHMVDHKGKKYKLGEATTREVESNTNTRYHPSSLFNLTNEYVQKRQTQRQANFLENLKESPEFSKIATRDQNEHPDWKPVDLPQFHGWHMRPYEAEVLNHLAKKLKGQGRVPVLGTINNFLSRMMFSVLSVWHDFNIANIATINRGISGVAPRGIARFAKTALPAMKHVWSLDDEYQRLYAKGAPFMRLGSVDGVLGPDAYAKIIKSFTEEMDRDSRLHPAVRALGYVPGKMRDAGKWWAHHQKSSMWTFNDFIIMQAIKEAQKRGMSEDEAIDSIRNGPLAAMTYELPTGSRGLNFLTHPDLTWFARYHLGLLKAYGKMIHKVVGKKHDAKTRAQGLDQLAMAGLFTFVAYPIIDAALKQMTGNKNASIERFGLSKLPYDIVKMTKGQESLVHLLAKNFTPAIGSQEVAEQIKNRDFYSGDQIKPFYTPSLSAQNVADRLEHAVTHTNYTVSDIAQGFNLNKIPTSVLKGVASQFGIKQPPSERQKIINSIEEKMQKKRKEAIYYREHPNR